MDDKDNTPMTDCELVLNYLRDGQWHNIIDMHIALKPNARNWACRSRVSDLRSMGHIIDRRIGKNGQAEYRLIKCSNESAIKTMYDRSGQSQMVFREEQI